MAVFVRWGLFAAPVPPLGEWPLFPHWAAALAAALLSGRKKFAWAGSVPVALALALALALPSAEGVSAWLASIQAILHTGPGSGSFPK